MESVVPDATTDEDQAGAFEKSFAALTGHRPMPWQKALYERCIAGDFPPSCSLPTGLGKTSIIHIWLIALATAPTKVPRRLVYVVNRRTVVDQATREAERLRDNLGKVPQLVARLKGLCAVDGNPPLAISTLRGQFADNGEWHSDPTRPAIVVGTVDMIGSRLLFSGYGCGFKTRPLQAGFLGQDVLLVHDEAHLEPAFQQLIEAVQKEQTRRRDHDYRPIRVMELSATSRGQEKAFELTDVERNPSDSVPDSPVMPVHFVWRRLTAKKGVHLRALDGQEKLADAIADSALRYKDSRQAVLLFAQTVENVKTIADKLFKAKQHREVLTGTLRGRERDSLVKTPIFQRFLPSSDRDKDVTPDDGTVYLVCTSAGEVGVNISADHLVCNLTPFDSMAQRFGRVNRFGDGDAEIEVIHEALPNEKKKDDPYEKSRWATLSLLWALPVRQDGRYDASPKALDDFWTRNDLPCKFRGASAEVSKPFCRTCDNRHAVERGNVFTPQPVILAASDILFDAWALTSVREALPGRPPVADWLHGVKEWEPPEAYVAWREEVAEITGPLLDEYPPADLLDDYPLKPHELLRDRTDRVFEELEKLADKSPSEPVWVIGPDGQVSVLHLREIVEKKPSFLEDCTVLLTPAAGGLRGGMLTGNAPFTEGTPYDVADECPDRNNKLGRVRVWNDDPQFATKTCNMRLIRTIDTRPDSEDGGEESTARRFWHWFELPAVDGTVASKAGSKAVTLEVHTRDIEKNAAAIVDKLSLADDLKRAVILAARFHDLGKRRPVFQSTLGNTDSQIVLAKSGRKSGRIPERYRHEFGSALDVPDEPEFRTQPPEVQDLALHLITAHHGRARPHFPGEEAVDPESRAENSEELARETPRRFARLQRKYGRWGLAYLESLVRAADYAASAAPSAFIEEERP